MKKIFVCLIIAALIVVSIAPAAAFAAASEAESTIIVSEGTSNEYFSLDGIGTDGIMQGNKRMTVVSTREIVSIYLEGEIESADKLISSNNQGLEASEDGQGHFTAKWSASGYKKEMAFWTSFDEWKLTKVTLTYKLTREDKKLIERASHIEKAKAAQEDMNSELEYVKNLNNELGLDEYDGIEEFKSSATTASVISCGNQAVVYAIAGLAIGAVAGLAAGKKRRK